MTENEGADLDLARLRLRQAEQRIVSRFPRAASDPQLASILSGLRDALGEGPEAQEAAGLEREPDTFRRQLAPDLAVAVDAGDCIVLEVTDNNGTVLRRPTVGSVDEFKDALDTARTFQHWRIEEADQRRWDGIGEAQAARRRERGEYDRREAVDFLEEHGMGRMHAANVVRRAEQRMPEWREPAVTSQGGRIVTYDVSYDGSNWHITERGAAS